MNNIISNCPLCEEHSLHVIGEDNMEMQQCINCGYVSSPKFIGTKEDNEEYKNLVNSYKDNQAIDDTDEIENSEAAVQSKEAVDNRRETEKAVKV